MDKEVVADIPLKVMTREEELAARELIDKKNNPEVVETENQEDLAERLELVNFFAAALRARSFDENSIIAFCSQRRSLSLLRKIKGQIERTDRGEVEDAKQAFPSAEQFAAWGKQEKSITTIKTIKFPTLCGWSPDETIKVMMPVIIQFSMKYATRRSNLEECIQNGSVGVLRALDTDAGIAPFWNHAYTSIRTNIRRPAATSGIIKEPEKTPSVTEVRHELTTWLAGWVIEYEMERLMGASSEHEFEAVGYDAPYKKFNRELYGRRKDDWDNKILDKIDLEGWKQSENLVRVGAAMWRMNDGTAIPAATLKSYRRMAEANTSDEINIEAFIAQADMQLACTQKTGIVWGMEYFVNQSFDLTRLPIEKLMEFGDYINKKYRLVLPPQVKRKEYEVCYRMPLVLPNQEKYKTVGDIVKFIATSPDFHRNPMSIDAQIKDGYTLKETIEDGSDFVIAIIARDCKEKLQTILDALWPRIDFTMEQRGVLEYLYGLNGKEAVSGAYLAENFGKLVGGKNERVSRQRITQYQDTIDKRVVEEVFKYHFYERENPQAEIERAIKLAEMSKSDTLIASKYFSMVEGQTSLNWMVENLHRMIPAFEQICASARREYLKGKILTIRSNLLRDIFGYMFA